MIVELHNEIVLIRSQRKTIANYLSYVTETGVQIPLVSYHTESNSPCFDVGYLPILSDEFPELKVIDRRSGLLNPEFSNPPGITFLEYQKEAIYRGIENKISGLPFYRGIYDCAPNSGKSFIILGLLYAYKFPRTLILIHSQEIFNQLIELIGPHSQVGAYGLKSREFKLVTIAMYKTLYNAVKGGDVNVLYQINQTQLLLVDEAHRIAGDYYRLVQKIPCFHRYFFSGTSYDRSNPLETLRIIGKSGNTLYKITQDQLISLGQSQRPIIHIYKLKARSFKDFRSEVEYLMYDIYRNSIILENSKVGQVFISVDQKEHGDHLFDVLKPLHRSVATLYGDTKERSKIIKQYKEGSIDILISTIFREGINSPKIRTYIHAYGKLSKIQIKQLIGRVVRHDKIEETVKVVDFLDAGTRVRNHTIHRISIYQQEKYEIKYYEEIKE